MNPLYLPVVVFLKRLGQWYNKCWLNTCMFALFQSFLRKACSSNPCQNSGTCINLLDAFFCLCPNNWQVKKSWSIFQLHGLDKCNCYHQHNNPQRVWSWHFQWYQWNQWQAIPRSQCGTVLKSVRLRAGFRSPVCHKVFWMNLLCSISLSLTGLKKSCQDKRPIGVCTATRKFKNPPENIQFAANICIQQNNVVQFFRDCSIWTANGGCKFEYPPWTLLYLKTIQYKTKYP